MATGTPGWIGKWKGGRIREGRDGGRIWVIEKKIQKRRYVVTLDVDTEDQAKAHLDLLVSNPAEYMTLAGKLQEKTKEERAAALAKVEAQAQAAKENAGLNMRGPLIQDFLDHQEAKGTNRDYRKSLSRYLKEWAKALDGRDLRTVTVTDLKNALKGWKSAKHARKVAIKSFFTWLETETTDPVTNRPLITSAQNAGRSLTMEKPKAAKLSNENLLIPLKTMEAVYAKISSQRVRDQLCILAKTGLHQTELARIAQGKNERGAVVGKLREVKPRNGIAGVLHVVHKSGHEHMVSLDQQCVAAAKRLQKVGRTVDRWAMARSIEAAAEAVNRERTKNAKPGRKVALVEPFAPKFLRHSFGTHAEAVGKLVTYPKSEGVDRNTIRRALGHRDERMFEEHYRLTEVPSMIVLPLKFQHDADPTGR